MTTKLGDGLSAIDAVRPFAELSRDDVAFAGGKGANLGELTRAGLPVPPGFVVGRARLRGVLRRDRPARAARGSARRASTSTTRPRSSRGRGGRARPGRRRRRCPPGSMRTIRAAPTRGLGGGGDAPVAVRSSATAEDTASASFAGMNETFLNVRGADAVVDAVRRCWASLFGARTSSTAPSAASAQADMDIAVVVQRQVASTRAGVMFTIDPATGRARPHRHRGRLRPRRERRLGQRLARPLRRRQADAGRRRARGPARRSSPIEPAAGRRHRARARSAARRRRAGARRRRGRARWPSSAVRIEAHYGAPQDTEWAFDADGARLDAPVAAGHLGRRRPREAEPAAGGEVLVRGLGAAPGQRERAGAAACASLDGRRVALRAGDVLVDAHDRARLGAADAPRGGDRHRLRRHDLPRGDRLARARHPVRRRHRRRHAAGCATASSSPSTPRTGRRARGAARRRRGRRGRRRPPRRSAPARRSPRHALLVNLSEPSQVERAAALDVDGVGLLRAELMVLEALEGVAPAAARSSRAAATSSSSAWPRR